MGLTRMPSSSASDFGLVGSLAVAWLDEAPVSLVASLSFSLRRLLESLDLDDL
jgi:hypothetical protein